MSVFPFVLGTPGHFGREPTPQEYDQILGLLAALHSHEPLEITPVTALDSPSPGTRR